MRPAQLGPGPVWAWARLGPRWRTFGIPALFCGTGELYVCNREPFFLAPTTKFLGSVSTGATPLRVVRVKKLPGHFSIGAASAADLFTTIAHSQRIHSQGCTNVQIPWEFLHPYHPQWSCTGVNISQEFRHWCKNKFKIAQIKFTGARKKCVRHRGLKHTRP